jgi:hypothetical protein
MNLKCAFVAAAAALCSLALPAMAESSRAAVAGEKLDSGLGSLPHYSRWADPRGRVVATSVPGESLDNGLGELPHYRLWVDRSGKDPMGKATKVASN